MIDHLVVGAGSAGCVLAARLSEDPERRVVLVEAGPVDAAREIHIPAGFHHLIGGELDWGYTTDAADDVAGRSRRWPRGRVLGGCSSINAMIWIRGHPDDYDGWAEEAGAEWSWDAALPLFRRIEDHVGGDERWHGRGGPMRIEPPRDPHPLSRAFVEAARQAGIPATDDFNGPAGEGVGFFRVNQRRGARWSVVRGYLDPARSRPNLEIRTGVLVRRLVWGHEVGEPAPSGAPRAVGVEVEIEGRRDTVRAREVILAAGAVGSPVLLLRSGVGPGAELRARGVDPVRDLPGVGRRLQDHPVVPVTWHTEAPSLIRAERLGPYLRYRLFRKGMLTSNVAEAGAFVRSRPDEARPDLQLHFAPAFLLDHGFANPDGDGFTVGPTLVRPESRGRITLRDPDPHSPPRIEAGTLRRPGDVARLVDGVRIALRIGGQPALAPYRGRRETPAEGETDAETLAHFVREAHQTLYHPTSTCAMGRGREAVVDPHLRIRGVEGVRIVDASVMPRIPAGNTQAPTLFVAERAVGWIRDGV